MILSNDRNRIEENDENMDLNIFREDFDLIFSSGIKILSSQFSYFNILS